MEDGKYFEANAAFTRITGYDPDEIRGISSEKIGIYDESSDRADFIAELKEKGRVDQKEIIFRRKDGTEVWGSISAVPMDYRGERASTFDHTGYYRA